MTEIKQQDSSEEEEFQRFLDYSKDSDDEWVKAVYRLYLAQEQKKAVMAAEGREFCPISEDGKINPEDKIKCLKMWCVPERILKNLGNLKITKPINYVREFALAPREAWCLILSGGKGTGKSTAAAAWLYEEAVRVPTHEERFWWNGTRIARTNGYNKEYEKMMKSHLMVIDDLGVEYLDKNGNFLQRLDELIDERYSNFKRTIITTNLNARAFKERYGERVADRMREGFSWGGGYMELSDNSMRSV